ncbi:hypothetical protein BHM03_00053937, partial [Ensete ventricosum]
IEVSKTLPSILSGIISRFSGDTCAALDGYHLNPQNSTLSSILWSSEHLPANFGLQDIRAGIHDTIDQVAFVLGRSWS